VQLTKLGEAELAWIAADRGLVAAEHSDDLAVTGSLVRSVVHALISAGKYAEAVRLTGYTADLLRPGLATPTPEITSATAPCSSPEQWPQPVPRTAPPPART
jgi:hypothetical protein